MNSNYDNKCVEDFIAFFKDSSSDKKEELLEVLEKVKNFQKVEQKINSDPLNSLYEFYDILMQSLRSINAVNHLKQPLN